MRTKRAVWAILLAAVAVIIMLISVKAYYIAVALVAGTLLFGHREIWSLITRRKLPPFDERIRENVTKSVRNGFVFFVFALAFLMLPFTKILISKPDTSQVLAGLLLSGGAVYLLSYFYYDRSVPNLGKRGLKMIKVFLILAAASLAVFILSAFLHNALSGIFKIEEPVFFTIAVILAPLGLAVGLIGSLVIFLKGLFSGT